MRNRSLTGAALFAVVLLAAGCGGGDAEQKAAPGTTPVGRATTVAVELTEWAVKPGVNKAATGQITFRAENKGAIPHELVIVRSEVAPEALPVVGGKVDESKVQVVGMIPEFASGKTQGNTFALAPGKYVLICNIPGHYSSGMRAAFTVE